MPNHRKIIELLVKSYRESNPSLTPSELNTLENCLYSVTMVTDTVNLDRHSFEILSPEYDMSCVWEYAPKGTVSYLMRRDLIALLTKKLFEKDQAKEFLKCHIDFAEELVEFDADDAEFDTALDEIPILQFEEGLFWGYSLLEKLIEFLEEAFVEEEEMFGLFRATYDVSYQQNKDHRGCDTIPLFGDFPAAHSSHRT